MPNAGSRHSTLSTNAARNLLPGPSKLGAVSEEPCMPAIEIRSRQQYRKALELNPNRVWAKQQLDKTPVQ